MTPDTILTILIFLPLAGGLLLLPLRGCPAAARRMALGVSLAELTLAVWLYVSCQGPATLPPAHLPGYLLVTDSAWIPAFGIRYTLGLDGLSLLLVLVTAVSFCLALALPWRPAEEGGGGVFLFLLLATESGIMGVFLSLDLILFYLFWEMMLIPMFFLIGIWGQGRTIRTVLRFFLFTLSGSLLMLLAITTLHLLHTLYTGVATFGLHELTGTPLPPDTQLWLYGAFFLAFAVKIPLFPLHAWLPDTYGDAPTPATLVLAAVMSKTGIYALIRFGHPLFPQAAQLLAPLLYTMAVSGIIYASLVAFAQEDMKRLIAWSSMGHVGLLAMGVAAWQPVALSGAILQMAAHGITTGALFLMAGMLEERSGTREITQFGGLWGSLPLWSFFFLFFAMASVGLPGLGNFVGEFLVLAGTFKASPLAAVLAFSGVVLTLVYMVRLVQETLFQQGRQTMSLTDLTRAELFLMGALALLNLWIGLHPGPLLALIRGPVQLLTGAG
jgi:NADH-quinone oxidoreductase subunit M